jgi:hypothetical protein
MKTETDQTGMKQRFNIWCCLFLLAKVTFRNFAYASHCQAYTNYQSARSDFTGNGKASDRNHRWHSPASG